MNTPVFWLKFHESLSLGENIVSHYNMVIYRWVNARKKGKFDINTYYVYIELVIWCTLVQRFGWLVMIYIHIMFPAQYVCVLK